MSRGILLNGTLLIEIRAAKNLPNLDSTWWRRRNNSDPYVIVYLDSSELVRSKYIPDDDNPEWNESHTLDVFHAGKILRLEIWDKDPGCDDKIGSVEFFTRDLFCGDPREDWYNVIDGNKEQPVGQINLRIQYVAREDKTFMHGKLAVELICAKDIPQNMSEAYVEVVLGYDDLVTTKHVVHTRNPEWNESFVFNVCHSASEVDIIVWNQGYLSSEQVGTVTFPVSHLLDGDKRVGWYDIKMNDSKKVNGQIYLSVQFHPIHITPSYDMESYFPIHPNCSVILYQDAHVNDDPIRFMEEMITDTPSRSCWKDIYEDLTNASHFICITGWSVHTDVKLLRGKDCCSLGELLIQKANDGLSVNLIVWDYPRTDNCWNLPGLPDMNIQDQDTYNYFLNTKVRCIQSRAGYHRNATTLFSHHQKTILCDAPAAEPMNISIVAYLGGLDLCKGRWDTPNHELFSTLLLEHKDDFYNNFVPTSKPNEGPRQPWHDVHLKVEGSIAYDVFTNFRERWGSDVMFYKLGEDWNLKIDVEALGISVNSPCAGSNDPSRWNCQLFRSITSANANFLHPQNQALLTKQQRIVHSIDSLMIYSDPVQVDDSIAKVYVQAIRNAKNFIYIETQYFMGSSNDWLGDNSVDCYNLVPMEITQKIVSKIKAGERFTAYIVLPIFPEGDPRDKFTTMQEQLVWQTRTIEMMYQKIASVLKDAGTFDESVPTDWLYFSCLGKREAYGEYLELLAPPSDEVSKQIRDSRRFPIYIHSKMMVVDDAYIIVGSQNINQRSLAGERDTEIAIGCWQPNNVSQDSMGGVKRFRMGLWLEHFKTYDSSFELPGSIECIKKVKELAKINWSMFIGPEGSVTPGHMLPYPLKVTCDGRLLPLDEEDIGDSELPLLLAERVFGSISRATTTLDTIGVDLTVLTT